VLAIRPRLNGEYVRGRPRARTRRTGWRLGARLDTPRPRCVKRLAVLVVLGLGPGGFLVAEKAVGQAVVELADELAGQVAQGGIVGVACGAALVVVGAGAG
jgi:hypothetical protein